MLEHVPAPNLLRFLKSGRRLGSSHESGCEYVFFSPTEVLELLEEADRVLASVKHWSKAYVPDVIRECLVGPFSTAKREGRALYASLG
jgi:hypothetical protein